MPSPANTLRKFLVERGKITSPGVRERPGDNLPQGFYDSMPDEVDHLMAFYDVSGRMFGKIQVDGQEVRHPGIRVVFRHTDPAAGYDEFDGVCRFLDALRDPAGFSATFDDRVSYFTSVYRASDLISLGEENGTRRRLWSITYNMVPGKAPTTLE